MEEVSCLSFWRGVWFPWSWNKKLTTSRFWGRSVLKLWVWRRGMQPGKHILWTALRIWDVVFLSYFYILLIHSQRKTDGKKEIFCFAWNVVFSHLKVERQQKTEKQERREEGEGPLRHKFPEQNTCFVPPCLKVAGPTCKCSSSKWALPLTPSSLIFDHAAQRPNPAGHTWSEKGQGHTAPLHASSLSSSVLTTHNKKCQRSISETINCVSFQMCCRQCWGQSGTKAQHPAERFSIHLASFGHKVVEMYWLFNDCDDADAG